MFSVKAAIGALIVSTLAAPIISTSAAEASTQGAPSGKITVDVQTVNGSGCKAGTAAVAVAPDNTAFTVTYSDYTAVAGPSAGPTDFRKNCQLSLLVHVPQGFTYAIAKADYRGFGSLAAGAIGIERAAYYFMGDSRTDYVTHTFNGPLSDNWQVSDETDYADLVYAPCGENRGLNVNTELRVNAGSSKSTSFMTMDSVDGSVNTTYHFNWKQC